MPGLSRTTKAIIAVIAVALLGAAALAPEAAAKVKPIRAHFTLSR